MYTKLRFYFTNSRREDKNTTFLKKMAAYWNYKLFFLIIKWVLYV